MTVHRSVQRDAIRLSALWLIASLAACGSDAPSTEPLPAAVATVTITPPGALMRVGDARPFAAVLKDADGNVLAERVVTWETSSAAIAAVSTSGMVTAIAAGIADIRAKSEGKSASYALTVSPALPTLTAVHPSSIAAGEAATLSVRGTHFTANAVVEWNGEVRTTQFVDATELRVSLSAAELAQPGMGQIRVRSAQPGNEITAPFTITITPPSNNAPAITRLMPDRIISGTSTQVVVAIIGTNFTPNAIVSVNGAPRAFDFFGPTTIRVILTPGDYAQPHALRLSVNVNSPGGGITDGVVTVYDIPVAQIDLEDKAGAFGANWSWVGWPLLYQATPRSASGDAIPQRAVTWTTSAPASVTLSPESDNYLNVYGSRAGTSTLTATLGDKSVSRDVTFFEVPPFDIVYVAGTGSNMALRLWEPHTGNLARTLVGNLTVTMPSPSPDGAYIAFSGSEKTNAPISPAPHIYLVRRDGTGLRQLTVGTAADMEPTWSPDGSRIAFSSSRANGTLDVYTMDVNGGDIRQLTQSHATTPVAGSGLAATSPAWSPDGQTIAYVVSENFRTSIWRMRADGSDKRRVYGNTTDNIISPSWTPNGAFIVATQQRTTANAQVIALTPDGLTAFPFGLTPPTFAAHPKVSPDGNWLIAGTNDPVNGSSLYVMPANGSRGQRPFVTPEVMGARYAQWMRRVTTQVR